METLWRIEAPHFVAGLIVKNDRITEAAPILRWAIVRSWSKTKVYMKGKGWHGCPCSIASDPSGDDRGGRGIAPILGDQNSGIFSGDRRTNPYSYLDRQEAD